MDFNEINIFGAGPAGLTVANKLIKNGFEPSVYESNSVVGIPQHCSGIVSHRFLEMASIPNFLVKKKFYGVELRVGGLHFKAVASMPRAYAIDRYRYELWLEKMFLDLGGVIRFNEEFKYDMTKKSDALIIDATGVRSYITNKRGDVLPAMQLIYRGEEGFDEYDDRIAYIFVDKDVNPDFFSWAINIGNNIWKLGSASNRNLWRVLSSMLSINRDALDKNSIKKLYGHVIVGGPVQKFFNPSLNVVLIGDSAGQVKVTTGGGLYYLLVASDMLIDALKYDAPEYSSHFYKLFKDEYRLQKMLRHIFLTYSQRELMEIVSIMSRGEFFNVLLTLGDMDFHMTSLVKLLMDRDFIKTVFQLSKYMKLSMLFRSL
ncbi:TPA: NAD(P)/FAD-dependent oxidoreductase [Candidatus Geothermarchaeota archaeon]|nr:NAD(P)/FAD-dependent oxidoreductase [Candidatus Geothermarchaeota archaeon]HIQ13185.1 NAD(P)/FAD-dependent oxidoreductase [Thermoprotei archaeon]